MTPSFPTGFENSCYVDYSPSKSVQELTAARVPSAEHCEDYKRNPHHVMPPLGYPWHCQTLHLDTTENGALQRASGHVTCSLVTGVLSSSQNLAKWRTHAAVETRFYICCVDKETKQLGRVPAATAHPRLLPHTHQSAIVGATRCALKRSIDQPPVLPAGCFRCFPSCSLERNFYCKSVP